MQQYVLLFVFVKKMANLSLNKDLVHPLTYTGRTVHWCVSRVALQFTQVLRTIRTRKRVHNPKFSWEPGCSLPAHMKEDTPVQTYVTANKGSYENTSFSLNRSHADFVSWPLPSAFLCHSPNRRKMTKERRFLWAWGQAVSLRKGSCAEEMARTRLKGSHTSWSLKSQKHSGGADRPWA